MAGTRRVAPSATAASTEKIAGTQAGVTQQAEQDDAENAHGGQAQAAHEALDSRVVLDASVNSTTRR